ncbi:MAG: leucine-rich repeat protein [Acutalibacteraceae bacterium]|nr:leucine-rich repeat protein [Acutalibacteraceae bacterium]
MKTTRFTKFLAVLLSVLMVSSVVFSSNAFAVMNVSDFEITETTWSPPYPETYKFAEITGFSENAKPEEISTLDLTVLYEGFNPQKYIIGKEAFKDNRYIEKLQLFEVQIFAYGHMFNYLPVVKIGEGAFENCTSLKSIDSASSMNFDDIAFLAECLEEIGSRAFKGCTSLDDLVIPSDVKIIGSEAFAGCTSLKRVVIYDSVKNIADDAFDGCDDLTIYANKNSSAHKYAISKNIPFVQIGESYYNYPDTELWTDIDYMSIMLNEPYRGSMSSMDITYNIYSFQEKWEEDLRRVCEEAIVKYENPFSTQVELEEAIANAKNAIYRAELIEEIYRLGNPWDICDPEYHCDACNRACAMIQKSVYPYDLSALTQQSYNSYLVCRDYAYSLVESGNATNESLAYSLQRLKWSVEALAFQVEEDLAAYVRDIPQRDLSIYTDDTAEVLRTAVSEAWYAVNDTYRYNDSYYYMLGVDSIETAMLGLKLKSIDTLNNLLESNRFYYKYEAFKYTRESAQNVLNEEAAAESLINGYDTYELLLYYTSYGKRSLDSLEQYNRNVISQTDRLEQAYENLELLPLGDVDLNYERNVADVVNLLEAIVFMRYLDEQSIYFADMNEDGNVTVLDAVLLQRAILEME